ncbi:GNAT family N-acetyltransferase [Nocardia sp. NPDC050718]|uniref:GNAT family N-acetyltransferase n=1 Tax=Nocardia sp. NPDC050718 TaxID=3155788 RepID=UPI0033F05D00
MGGVHVDEIRSEDDVDQIIDLWKHHNRTLGLMPAGAFKDAAFRGWLIGAWIGGKAVGYALFRLPRNNKIILAHLCVADEARGSGVARALITAIRDRHSSRLGIRAKCRNDYNLDKMWSRLGFHPHGTAVGRGRDRSPMTVWWLDYGHPDLFSSVGNGEPSNGESNAVEAALDLNILMDLHIRKTSERSQVLAADHLDGLRLVVTDGVHRELARQPVDRRARLESAANQYPHRAGEPGRAAELYGKLAEAATECTMSMQDEGDLWQIAEAVAAGVEILLTWDDGLRSRFNRLRARIPELTSLQVVDPDHLVTYLDELAHLSAYQPARLQGSDYDRVRAGASDEACLMNFLGKQTGEARGELRDALRRLARQHVPCWLIRTGDADPIACYAAHLDGNVLRVPLFRTAGGPMSETIAHQLLWLLRRDAKAQGAQVIDVTDEHVDGPLVRAMASEPFHQVGEHRYAWVVAVCGTSHEVTQATNAARRSVGVPPGPLHRPELPPHAAAELERTLWPAKLSDSSLPHYIIPIQPKWSGELLGYPDQLTTRPVELSLGREQVYYRSARPRLKAPARILWRVSKTKHNPSGIIGTSTLDAVFVDTPERLHAIFSKYGVFDWRLLETLAAAGPMIQALQFSDTELFDRPISEYAYNLIREEHGGPGTFYSPRLIGNQLFTALYRVATG